MTIIVIAHRLSTIRNADQVLVMNEGEIIQAGDYHQLAREKEGVFGEPPCCSNADDYVILYSVTSQANKYYTGTSYLDTFVFGAISKMTLVGSNGSRKSCQK